MRKIKYIVCILTIIGLVGPFTMGNIFTAKAVVSSGITASVADTSLNATTTYTYNFKVNSALSVSNSQDRVVFNIQNWYAGPSQSGAVINLNNASVTWIKDDGSALSNVQKEITGGGQEIRMWAPGPLTVAAGSNISIKLSGVKNPSVAGSYSTRVGTGTDTGAGWNEGEQIQQDNLIILGVNKFIEGRVTYDTGGGVSTCSINANKQGAQEWAHADCDNNGYYSLPLTQTGTWQLHVDAKWQEGQRVTTDWIYEGMDKFVEVPKAGTYTQNFTVVKATAAVKGKIVLPNGSVPSNPWQYHVDVRDEQGRGSGSSLDNSGVFNIPVKPGTYKLSLHSDNPKYYISEVKVTVKENETKNLGTITLSEKTAKIQGKVTDANGNPIDDLRMNMWGKDGWGEARTTGNGTYTLWTYKGEWEIMVDQWEASQKGLIVQGPPTRISITSDSQTVTGINFSLIQSNATVKLYLVDSGGNAITNIHGYAYCRKADAMPGPGSEFGTGIGGPNQYASIPILGGYDYVCGAHLPSEFGLSVDKEVQTTVAVGETKSVNITLIQNDGEIIGYLREAVTGEVVTNVEGDVFAHGESMGMGFNTFINPDGSYRLSVRNGTYFVGYNIWTPGYMRGNPDHAPVTVPPNGRVVKTIKVHKANAYIVATVKDPDGNPVPWAWVWCDNMKQKEEEMKGPFEGGEVLHTGGDTGDNGIARLGVVAGQYSCGAGLPPEMSSFMPPDNVDVLASANTDTPITLQFKQSEGSLNGTVTYSDGSPANMGFCHGWNPNGGFTGSPVFSGQYIMPLTRGTWYVGCDSMDGRKFYRSEETPITLNTVGDVLSKNFVLREASFELPDSISTTFDASQMTVITLPDESTIAIPANAVANEGNYTLTASPNVNLYHTPEAKPALGFAWSLELTDSSGQPVTTNFNSNVTITVKYDEAYLEAEGIDETKIIGRYWDEGSSTWKLPDNVVQDLEKDAVMIQVNHFTDFAITTGSGQYGERTIKSIVTAPKAGGGPHITRWNSVGTNEANFMAYATNFLGGVKALHADLDGDGTKEIITVPYSGGGPHLRVFNSSGEVLGNLFPYVMAFRGGLSVAVGNVDGVAGKEVIIAPTSGGGPHVRVYKFDGSEFTHYASFFAYPEGLRTGMEVQAGDVDGDGDDDIVTTTKTGATPHVRTFDGQGNLLGQFFAFPTAYRGGVNLTLGDYTGDGAKELIVTPTSEGGPQYRVMTYSGGLIKQDFAYNSAWRLGLKSGVGDVDGDGNVEIVLAPTTGGPHIQVIGANGLESSFMAYDSAFRGGLELAVADVNADGTAEIVTVPMSQGGPHVKVMNSTGGLISHFMSHHSAFRGGVNLSLSQ